MREWRATKACGCELVDTARSNPIAAMHLMNRCRFLRCHCQGKCAKLRQRPRATAAGFALKANQLHAPDIGHGGILATGAIDLWFAGCMREGQDENCLLLTTGLDSAV